MKKLSFLLLTVVIAASFTVNAADGKVKIKHKGKVIEVSSEALDAHLDHGDVQLKLHNGKWLTQAEIDAEVVYPPNCGPNGCVDEPNGEE
jgi:hypothetical protein